MALWCKETKKNSIAKGRSVYLRLKDQQMTNHISNKEMQMGVEHAQQERENVKKEKVNSLKDRDIQNTSKDGLQREELKKNPRKQAKGVVSGMFCLCYKVGEI